ncbi:MAG: M56 family metallopeptidase [Bacteroidaceae bacterium]|nr:M56 family metallopeptidase [Bacteroidaceae bacterium]
MALLYGAFALLLSRETFHRLNRLALLCVLVASVALPAIQITLDNAPFMSYMNVGTLYVETNATTALPGMSDTISDHTALLVTETAERESDFRNEMMLFLRCLYVVGLLVSLSLFLVQMFRLWRDSRGGVHTKDEAGNTVVIHAGDFAPYSFLHYIFINASDYETLRRPILAHEQAHIRLCHTFDLLLFEVVKAIQWFNPFVYLLGRDLKAVHEYEADNAVLNFGIDAKTYQLLLVTKAVGGRLQTVCNNLSHHSLKKRIKMMQKNESNRWLMGKVLVLPALMALAVVAFAKPKTTIDDGDKRNTTTLTTGDGTAYVSAADNSERKMLTAFRMPKKGVNPVIAKRGDGIIITWLKGTWVEKDSGSYVEERPVCESPYLFHTAYGKILLDGKEVDIDNLPDLPASALKKMEIRFNDGRQINLITTPVQIPANVKGNISRKVTILLTGTVPPDAYMRSSIYVNTDGILESFNWKDYDSYTQWTGKYENVRRHIKDLKYTDDYNVRVNVRKGVSQEHIDRLKSIFRECGVTRFNFARE